MILDSVLRGNSHLVICGDFNYPNIDWENEFIGENFPIIAPFLDTIQGYYLHQHVFQPTRYRDGDDPGIFDLILSNEEGMVYNLTHHSGLGNSDHACLKFNLSCDQQITKKDKMPNYFKADYKTIRARLD